MNISVVTAFAERPHRECNTSPRLNETELNSRAGWAATSTPDGLNLASSIMAFQVALELVGGPACQDTYILPSRGPDLCSAGAAEAGRHVCTSVAARISEIPGACPRQGLNLAGQRTVSKPTAHFRRRAHGRTRARVPRTPVWTSHDPALRAAPLRVADSSSPRRASHLSKEAHPGALFSLRGPPPPSASPS